MTRLSGVVAFLFTDLVGSTELLDRLGDDVAEELRRVHFSLLRAAVVETGGEEVKSLGDGLMISFASPLSAITCAVAMQRAIAGHNQHRTGPRLGVRVGVHAGEPVRDQGDFFGAAVVVAKRLCDQAQGGQILASELVAGVVGTRGGFRFRPVGRLALKGLAEPLPAVAVEWAEPSPSSVASLAGPARRQAPRGPALVGRDRELAVLEGQLAQAATGELRVVLVSADPGLGKTRLARELLARHAADVVGLSARAHPLGGTTSFGLWAEAFEGHLRALSPQEISGLCGGFVYDLGALLRSVAVAGGTPPSGDPPRARLLEGLAVLLDNIARAAPVVVFLDDVHVADASSWDALHYLARNLASSPILIVAAARPAELATHVGPTQVLFGLEQDGVLRRLELAPLPTDAVGELAGTVLGRAPPPTLVAWLDDRSKGNPLFALGLVQALVDEGADLAAPRLRRLPEGLAERVIVRLGELDEPARATLEVLAVVGRRLELGSVVGLTSRSLDQTGPILDALVRSRLLAEDERGREVAYEIRHPLIQEAIHQGLGAARRRALHRLVGRFLISSNRLGEAALHFAQSAEVGDPEAISVLLDAFRQAEERDLYREALDILGALVDLIPAKDGRWLGVLDAMQGPAEWVVDNLGDVHVLTAIKAMEEIDALLEGTGDPARRAAVKFRLANFLARGTGELDEAEHQCAAALHLFEQVQDRRSALLARSQLAWIEGFRGNLPGQQAAAQSVVEAAEAAKDRFAVMQSSNVMGAAAFLRGRFDDAEQALGRTITIARQDGKLQRLTLALVWRAGALALEGRITEALSVCQEIRSVNRDWREVGFLQEFSEPMVYWLAGDFPAALATASEALDWNAGRVAKRQTLGMILAAVAGAEMGRTGDAHRYLGVCAAALGERPWMWSDAVTWAEAVLTWREGQPGRALDGLSASAPRILGTDALPFAAFALTDLVELAVESHRVDAAVEAADHLDRIARALDRDLYRALARLGEAWAALGSGAVERAAQASREAAALLAGSGYGAFYGRALAVLGQAISSNDRPRAIEAFQAAAATFETCGATWRRERALEALRHLGKRGDRAATTALGPGPLTKRERQVARLAAQGHTAREIGERLFIGERTVESHLARIYAKLGVASKLDLVQRSGEFGLD